MTEVNSHINTSTTFHTVCLLLKIIVVYNFLFCINNQVISYIYVL